MANKTTKLTLQDYIWHLKGIMELHPDFKDLPLVYATGDESADYHKVTNFPSLFSVLNPQIDRNLEPDLDMLSKSGQDVDTGSEEFLKLNCIILN